MRSPRICVYLNENKNGYRQSLEQGWKIIRIPGRAWSPNKTGGTRSRSPLGGVRSAWSRGGGPRRAAASRKPEETGVATGGPPRGPQAFP